MFYLWPHLLHIIEIRGANNYRHLVIFGSCQDIYYWWGCRVGFTPNTAAFCWRCFQTNKPLLKSEHLVLVAVYLKILNACKLIVIFEQITLIWSSVNSLFYWAFCSIYRWREFDKCVIHPSPDPSPWIKSLQTTNQHLTYCWTTNQNAFLNHSLTPFPLPWAV